MNLFAAGVLGDSLGALRHGVLGQLTWQQETNSGLDFAGRDRRATVEVSQSAGLAGDSLEDIVDERVHDAHGLGGHTGVGVHLLQDLVDVDRVGLLPLSASLALASLNSLRWLDSFLCSL